MNKTQATKINMALTMLYFGMPRVKPASLTREDTFTWEVVQRPHLIVLRGLRFSKVVWSSKNWQCSL
jgi:hypothetical protein